MQKLVLLTVLVMSAAASAAPDYDSATRSFKETLSALVKADTTNPPGNEARAVAIVAERLKKEGIPFEITEFAPGRQNIVARLKGSGERKPLLLLAHLDVVGVKDQAWTVPHNEMTEKDGFFYGRGVQDDLGMAAVILETASLLKKSGTPLKRDVIIALTGDEESGGAGLRYILENKRESVDAEIALNEGGAPYLIDGKVAFLKLQVAEKIYQDYKLIAKGETGHSAAPKKNNAIYRLAKALDRLGKFEPENRLLPATRAYFKGRAAFEPAETKEAMLALVNAKGKLPLSALKKVKENPIHASVLATTCVATMLAGGTKANALPPVATANVNCRLLPDETIEQVQRRLAKIINDPAVDIEAEKNFGAAGPSPTTGEVPTTIAALSQEMWPGSAVIPVMQVGATDSRLLRAAGIQAYGFSSLATTESDALRSHGIDERIHVASIRPGIEFFHKLVVKLAGDEKKIP